MSMAVTAAPRRVLESICAEYDQMPGMRLTRAQVRRLWGLDARVCDSAILELIGRGYLREDADGRLHRAGVLTDRGPAAEPS